MQRYRLVISLQWLLLLVSCDGLMGSNSLGDDFVIWEGDSQKARVITYCSKKSLGRCEAGIYILPTYERHMVNGKYAEYVKDAKSNPEYIIARTILIENDQLNYWIINKKGLNFKKTDCSIINCDSIIRSHVIGPLTRPEFDLKIQLSKIDLRF